MRPGRLRWSRWRWLLLAGYPAAAWAWHDLHQHHTTRRALYE